MSEDLIEGEEDAEPPEQRLRDHLNDAGLRRSRALDRILEQFGLDPTRAFRAFELMEATGLLPGSLHPVLDKLTDAGWLEVIRHRQESGRLVKSYRMTSQGCELVLLYFRDTLSLR